MKYSQDIVDDILLLNFEGDLIGENNVPDLMQLIDNSIDKNIMLCAVDISGIRYMNSSGIGVLITILTKFRNKGGEVVLINPSSQVKKLLIITKLNNIFQVVKNKEEAIEKLKS